MQNKRKFQDLFRFLKIVVAVVFINWLASYAFFRIDLTEDQRYSISPSTKNVIKNIDSRLEVRIYLHGNFPPMFKSLEKSIQEKLDEMKAYGGVNIKYEFIDPASGDNKEAIAKRYRILTESGLQPTNLHSNEEGKRTEKLIYPGAIIKYGSRQLPVNFLKSSPLLKPEERINQAIESVEFELASAIRKITQKQRKRIAFLDGNRELNNRQLEDLIITLSDYYEVGRMNISTMPSIDSIDAIVIAQPKTRFSESDKLKIDQYLMNGGKALFFIDPLEVRRDSNGIQALAYDLNISDMLFTYGVRINQNMIQDLYSAPIPIMAGTQYQLLPWNFYPLLNQFSSHPIVRNMDAIYAKYISTVDTVKSPGVIKTPLVFTSKYTRVKGQPVVYSAEELRIDMDKAAYPAGKLPVAWLLEGTFTSHYKNRPLPDGVFDKSFKEKSEDAKIVICSDGDLLANDIDIQSGKSYPLGYDKYTRQTYSNKDFVINSIDYLLDEEGLVKLRSKVVQLRPLDKFKIKSEETKWKIINMVLPLFIILVFGIIRSLIRKKKFG